MPDKPDDTPTTSEELDRIAAPTHAGHAGEERVMHEDRRRRRPAHERIGEAGRRPQRRDPDSQ